MTRDVVELHPPAKNLRCSCGSEWWGTRGVVIDAATGEVTGYAAPLRCTSCGRPAAL